MKSKHIIFIIGIILVVGGLLWFTAPKTAQGEFWPGTNVPCLENGHDGVSRHIHPTLKVFVQGQEIPIRANIGVSDTCMAEIHTHDTTGALHIETNNPNTTRTIGDFFAILGEEMERDGFILTTTLNGELVEDIANYPLQENDAVVLSYESAQGTEEIE